LIRERIEREEVAEEGLEREELGRERVDDIAGLFVLLLCVENRCTEFQLERKDACKMKGRFRKFGGGTPPQRLTFEQLRLYTTRNTD